MTDIGLEIEELLEARPKAAPAAGMPDLYEGGTFVSGEVKLEQVALEVSAVRELLDEDILRLQAARADRVNGPKGAVPLELRTRHHEIARLLVLGQHTQCEIAGHLGLGKSTISMLKRSKTFQQLLLFYTEMRNQIVTDPRAVMNAHALENLEILRERVVNTEDGAAHEKVGFNSLASHTMNMLDRSGHGPSRTERQEHVYLTEDDMKEIKLVEAEFERLEEGPDSTPVGEALPEAQTGEPPAEVPRG